TLALWPMRPFETVRNHRSASVTIVLSFLVVTLSLAAPAQYTGTTRALSCFLALGAEAVTETERSAATTAEAVARERAGRPSSTVTGLPSGSRRGLAVGLAWP